MIDGLTLANLVAYVLQSTAVIAVALTALWILRIDAPGVRYTALRTTLALALVLPFLQPWVTLAPAVSFEPAIQQASSSQPPVNTRRAIVPPAVTVPFAPSAFWIAGATIVLLAGMIGRLLWLSAGLWRLQRLRKVGESAAGNAHADLQHVIGTAAELRYVAGLEQPLTFGFRRPVVLLPESLRNMALPVQRAVVAHELWHVRRLDWPWMVLEEGVRSAFWFHPAMWILLSRIQIAREENVDELAILTTGSRRNYLDALLAFADARPIFAVAAFARRRHLLHRMITISKESVMSSKRLVFSGAALLVLVGATAWTAAAAFPLTDQTPPRDPRPAPTRPSEMVFVPANEADLQELIGREPKNPAHYRALAAFYVKAGDFDRAISTLEALAQAVPSNPAHHQQIGVFYWEKAFRDHTLMREQKMVYILSGIAALDRALAIDPDYQEALIYKNILLRLQATYTTDISEQRRLIAEADTLRSRAMQLNKQRQVSPMPGDTSAPPPPPPPPPPVGPIDGVMPVRVGGDVPAPVKIRDVKPVYPPEARAARITGFVEAEVVLDAAGLVRDARIVRSVPLLDESALSAIRQWQFAPTVIDGVARPIVMTVTVSYNMQ